MPQTFLLLLVCALVACTKPASTPIGADADAPGPCLGQACVDPTPADGGDGVGTDPDGDSSAAGDPHAGDAAPGDDTHASDAAAGGDSQGGEIDPNLAPLYIVAFSVAYQGDASDGGEIWVDVRVGNAALLDPNWRLMSASFDTVDAQLAGGDLEFTLHTGDILRFHGPEYPGTTDTVKTDNHPDKWDVTSLGGYVPSFKHGILWIEDGDGHVLDLVAYVTDSNDGDWLTGSAQGPLYAAVGRGEWPDSGLDAALQLGDSSRNFARLSAPGLDGNAAADWEIAGAESPFYYEEAQGLTGTALKSALNVILKRGHTVVAYDEVPAAFSVTDRDPNDPVRITEFYTGIATMSDYNREHLWAKSHGGFSTDSMVGYSDLHNLRPTRPDINSARWHLDFDAGGALYSNTQNRIVAGVSFEPRDAVKGDVARALLYMAVRYQGDDGNMPDLELVEAIPSLLNAQGQPDNNNHVSTPHHGRLSTLLGWHVQDPPDDEELRRNDVIFETLQHNRNPFVDHPEWVHEIWGGPAWPY